MYSTQYILITVSFPTCCIFPVLPYLPSNLDSHTYCLLLKKTNKQRFKE